MHGWAVEQLDRRAFFVASQKFYLERGWEAESEAVRE